jgi:hypothetical protein
MKINVLTLEDLSESQTDVAVPADLPEEGLQDLKDGVQEQEELQAETAAHVEEQTESQSLIDQVVALEALYEKIGSLSTFPAELAMEAYDAAPDAYIMETYRSGASTGAKISVAMEGIMSKAWESIKRFWAHLVQMWKKFVQYADRFLNGKSHAELTVDTVLINKLETILHEAQQRWHANQQKGIVLRDHPEENTRLIAAYHMAGSGKAAAALTKMKEILPKCGQFIQLTEKYIRDLERWATESKRLPSAQTVMPASPESSMYDFVEACEAVGKGFNYTYVGVVDQGAARVPLALVLSELKTAPIQTEYGIEKTLSSAMYDTNSFIIRRSEEVQKITGKDDVDSNVAKIYRAMGQELASLKQIVGSVFMLFPHALTAQKHILNVGRVWIRAVSDAYADMARNNAHYSEADIDAFKAEKTAFEKLETAYSKLLADQRLGVSMSL